MTEDDEPCPGECHAHMQMKPCPDCYDKDRMYSAECKNDEARDLRTMREE